MYTVQCTIYIQCIYTIFLYIKCVGVPAPEFYFKIRYQPHQLSTYLNNHQLSILPPFYHMYIQIVCYVDISKYTLYRYSYSMQQEFLTQFPTQTPKSTIKSTSNQPNVSNLIQSMMTGCSNITKPQKDEMVRFEFIDY